MAVINDYVCMAHGEFESRTGKCPHGCGSKMVQVIFKKAPGLLSGRTKAIDATLRGMAQENGLTNMNNRGGDPVFKPDAKFSKDANEMQAKMLAGQTFAGGMGQGGEAVTQVLQSNGFQGDNALNSDFIRSQIQQPKPIVHASWDGK